jgi:hypothetical protein
MSANDVLWDMWAKITSQINALNINADTIKLSKELTDALREAYLAKEKVKYVLEWEGRYLKTCYREHPYNSKEITKVTNVDKLSEAMLFDSKNDGISYALKWDLGHKPIPVKFVIEKVILP